METTASTASRLQATDVVLFLDFDGVLHPDDVYRTRHGLELRAPGALMMHAPLLVELLESVGDGTQ